MARAGAGHGRLEQTAARCAGAVVRDRGSCGRSARRTSLPSTILVAPAGYGKTTLLVEWSRRDERPFAWITLDARDNEPRRLLGVGAPSTGGAVDRNAGQPFVIVFDDAHAVREPLAVAALATIAGRPPAARETRDRVADAAPTADRPAAGRSRSDRAGTARAGHDAGGGDARC